MDNIAYEMQSPDNADGQFDLYIPNEEETVVTIIRVMHGGRDMDIQFKKYTRQ